MVQGFGFKVQSVPGLRIQGFDFEGLGVRIEGLWLRIEGLNLVRGEAQEARFHPDPVLESVTPFFETFCGHLSPNFDKSSNVDF